jgi:hypothetical protein
MVITLGTDLLIGLEVGAVKHGLTGRALDPEAFGHRAAGAGI